MSLWKIIISLLAVYGCLRLASISYGKNCAEKQFSDEALFRQRFVKYNLIPQRAKQPSLRSPEEAAPRCFIGKVMPISMRIINSEGAEFWRRTSVLGLFESAGALNIFYNAPKDERQFHADSPIYAADTRPLEAGKLMTLTTFETSVSESLLSSDMVITAENMHAPLASQVHVVNSCRFRWSTI